MTPAEGSWEGEGIPLSTTAPVGDTIGSRMWGPGRVEIGGEMTGDCAGAAATTPGDMGYCWLMGNMVGWIT